MEAMAAVLGDRDIEGEQVRKTRYIQLRDGSVYPTEVWGHTDELVEELVQQNRDDKLLQEADRMRAVRAQEGDKFLMIFSPVPLNMPVDAVFEWDTFLGGSDTAVKNANIALLRALSTGDGIVPDSPSGAAKFRSDVFGDSRTSRRYYAAWPENWRGGLERVVIQERQGNQKMVLGWQLTRKSGGYSEKAKGINSLAAIPDPKK